MSELALKLIEENKKTRATFLDLGFCGLTEVPDEIGELVWLEELSFSCTRWKNNIPHVSENSYEYNNILHLNNGIKNLKQLKKIWLSGDYWQRFGLTDLRALSSLDNLYFIESH